MLQVGLSAPATATRRATSPSPGADRLAVFAFLWAAAEVVHHASFPWWFDRYALLNVMLVASALLVLVRPRSIAAFTALAALGLLNVVKLAPFHPNHILFEGFVDTILLAALLLHRLRWDTVGSSESQRRETLFDSFAAPIRTAYLLLFGFAFLHKLNWDFLAADVSCAVEFPDALLTQHGLPPLATWLRKPVIWASLTIEAAIPFGLLFARTRFCAVMLALLFHLLLALNGVIPLYSFAAEMFAVLFLFTPSSFTDAISETLMELRGALRRPSVRVVGTLAACVAAIYLFEADARRLWIVWALGLVAVFVHCSWRCRGSFRIENAFRVRPRVLWAFLVLLVLNALNPYLGLKTETSFSMFSNLRTEGGGTNHLFLGRRDLGTWQDDLVRIIDSDLPAFVHARDEDVLLPYFEFRRTAGTADRDFRVEYRHREGEVRTLVVRDGVASDPAAATPPSWWLRKILCFRPVQREGATHCRH